MAIIKLPPDKFSVRLPVVSEFCLRYMSLKRRGKLGKCTCTHFLQCKIASFLVSRHFLLSVVTLKLMGQIDYADLLNINL